MAPPNLTDQLSEGDRTVDGRLRKLLAAGRIGTWNLDFATGELLASDVCKTNFGRKPGDSFTYADLAASVIDEDRERWRSTVDAAIAAGGNLEVEYRIRWPDGSPHWVLVRGSCVQGPDRQVVGMMGISIDITDQKLVQEKLSEAHRVEEALNRSLQANEERLREVLQATGVGTWTVDVQAQRLDADESLRALHLYPAHGPISLAQGFAPIHADDVEAVKAAVTAALAGTGDGRYRAEYRVSDAAGELRWIEARGRVTFDEHGLPIRFAGTGLDITARKRAEQDEVRLRREAETASRAKDEFLAMLGHEMRNPLAPIATALQLMKLLSADVFVRERTIIERQVDHLTRLVDDLLDISRITSGKVEIHRQSIGLSTIVASAVEMVSPLLEVRQHQLHVDVPAQGLTVDGDPGRLAQVVSNLLTNAAKYTEPRGRIDIVAEAVGGEALLRIRDNGVGIAPEMLPRVFDLFAQERQSIDRALGGLGLGLAIVKTIIAVHGGSVSAHSLGRNLGSEFKIRLPLAVAPTRGEAADGQRTAGPVARRDDGRRVLVVDDNTDAAELLAAALEIMGHEVRIAVDGPTALQLVEGFVPDVAVLDIGLPVMDGYELGRRLRERPGLGQLPLVALTGYGQSSDRTRSADAGFRFHLVKPVQIAQLQAIIADAGLVAR